MTDTQIPPKEQTLQVLFVDDETSLLDGLRRSLRKMRNKWEMRFASSGAEALELLKVLPADVVVSDMRMPGMDGVELLTRVRDSYPQTVRIVLSGQTEMQSALRSVAVAHAFLHKPCESDVLETTIDRSTILVRDFDNEKLRAIMGKLDALPSPPRLIEDLNACLMDPYIEIDNIVSVVESDAAITAKLMQLANSPFFGSRRKILDVKDSITLLGLSNVRDLAAQSLLFGSIGPNAVDPTLASRIDAHSCEVARVANALHDNSVLAREILSASVLHDVGGLVIAVYMPEENVLIQKRLAAGEDRSAVESEILGVTHSNVGAYLLSLWGIPQYIVEAVAWHHNAPLQLPWQSDLVHLLYIADALCKDGAEALEKFPDGYLDKIGCRQAVEDVLTQPKAEADEP